MIKKTSITYTGFSPAFLALIPSALYVLFFFKLAPYQLDDAFITYRYVENYLATGLLSYNPHGEVVEGFSSPLWFLVLLGVASVAGIENLTLIVPWLSLVVMVGALFAIRGMVSSRVQCWAIAAFMLTSPGLLFYLQTGLEGGFFALLVALASLALMLRRDTVLLVLLPLIILVRPEGVCFALSILIATCFDRTLLLLYPKLLFIGLFSVLLLFGGRYYCFGEWLPNTYYAKQADYGFALQYLWRALASWYFLPYFIVGLLASVISRGALLLFLMGLGWLLVAFVEGGDWMPMGRFLLPSVVLFMLAAGWAFGERHRGVGVLAVLLLCAGMFSELQRKSDELQYSRFTSDREHAVLKNILITAGVDSVALVDIGEFAYGTDITIVDLAGLTDREVASFAGGHLVKRLPLDFIAERKPSAVVVRIVKDPGQERIRPSLFASAVEARVFKLALEAGYRLDFMVLPADAQREPYYGSMVLTDPVSFSEPVSDQVDVEFFREGIPSLYVGRGG